MTAFIMKRSIWASGRLNVPSSLDRILGGDHHERLGQEAIRCPPMVVAPSAMASSMADWVLAFRTVDLVQQYEIGVNRTDLRGELLRRKIEDLRAHQIRWHEIRSATARA